MATNTKSMFVATINGVEKFFEANPYAKGYSSDSPLWTIQRLVRESGLTTPRNNPQTVKITVEVLKIGKNNSLERQRQETYDIAIPLAPMTSEEYRTESKDITSSVPMEFREVLGGMVEKRGTYFEEKIALLEELVANFKPAIDAYAKRLKIELQMR